MVPRIREIFRHIPGERTGILADFLIRPETKLAMLAPDVQLRPEEAIGADAKQVNAVEPKESPEFSGRGIKATPERLPEQIGVMRDWDTLKSVMVGIPDHDVLPAWYPDWEDPDGNEVDGPPGQTKRENNPEKFAGAVRQSDQLCEVLEREGVRVFRSPLTSLEFAKMDPVGLTAQYCREIFAIIGNNIILCQMRAPHRNKERPALEPFLQAIMQKFPGTKLLAPPTVPLDRNDDWEHDPRPFLEGGDIFRLGKDVLVGMSYLASSPSGFRWLADSIEPDGFNCWPVYVEKDWEHFDYIFSVVREGLCICYLDGLKDKRLPTPIADWDVINVTYDEAYRRFASNGLALRPGVVLMPSGCKRIVRELEKKGADVIEVEFGDVQFWQGGLDCATNELWRESVNA